MTFVWAGLSLIVAVLVIVTIVDIVLRHYSFWATAGWIVLVLVLPLIGSILYFSLRRSPPEEVEEAYLAQSEAIRDARRSASDTAGLGGGRRVP